MKGGVRRTSLACLLVVCSGLLGLGAAELALRIANPSLLDLPSRHRLPHPVFGWALEPGADYLNREGREQVRVRVSSAGWRDRERTIAKPAKELRIAVLGDSFVESYSVDLEDSFPMRLERGLEGPDRPVEVLNFGVGGFGTLQEYLVYRNVACGYAPDLVLLGFCVGNDLRDNSRELESLLNGSPLQQMNRPFLRDGDGPWDDADIDLTAPRRAYRELSASRLRRLLRRSVLVAPARRVPERLRAALGEGPSRADLELAVHGVHYCRETPEYARAWRLTERILRRLRDDVRAQGAELVVFSEPTYREVDARAMRSIEDASPAPARLCLEQAPGFARLGSVLRDLGIAYVDLLADFRRSIRDRELFRTSDRHWNAAGHALVAAALEKALARRLLVPAAVGTTAPAARPPCTPIPALPLPAPSTP